MQCTDIFFLKADICQLGLDQRKVNMLAREYCDLIGKKLKPVILSHHMLAGLKQGQAKMSKSDPDSAIFMEDTEEDVRRKILQAYCPKVAQQQTAVTEDGAPESTDDKNPILDYYQCVVFSRPGASTKIGEKEFSTYEALESAFISDEVSEEALKEGLVTEINALLDPVRHHFQSNEEAKDLLEQVKSFRKAGVTPESKNETVYVAPDHPIACVFLPAQLRMPVTVANGIVKAVQQFLEQNPAGEVKAILPQWSAMGADELTGDEKDIKAALEYNVLLLQKYGLPSTVTVTSEEDLILADPNLYWFTTINVGRKNTLAHIETLYGGEVKNAGQVIAALMKVSDALLLKATHVLQTSFDGNTCELIKEFTAEQIKVENIDETAIPALHRPDAAPAILGVDDVLYLDDTEMDIRRKIKKAYSAPNESENPVIAVAAYFLQKNGEVLVERGEANGGNITYDKEAALREDCGSGALHPGDLKTAVAKLLVSSSETCRAALSTPEVKKLSQTLKNAEKKMAKKK
ncbi:tyrosyl-tRNA synthetase [Angomonas deanei]|uniref:tyrosine--tRNA ligase n=1 Tax=Angomonas deanei TaxID=59799 RepID=A0A7G2CHQ6_9TRYP|nr:tyrosyl-tRNA synthetase [Angomonas deanei]CAD2219390.1 tRNA synthetases class I (W and Y), putative [Angomonas deanei]|eukprot:EPY29073.1 tyrosyl-tRNA synthetase [Angomonas deanei]